MSRSEALFLQAQQVIPGGVNSPVRAFRAVGGTPPFIREGRGAVVIDEDDREYIDYVGSWGPLVAGHAHPEVVKAVVAAAGRGTSYGAPTAGEVRLAERLCGLIPSMEMVRLVNSGTEATMSAIRLARAATGREILVKFAGGYHGHADSLLVAAGSGAATFGVPSSPGVPQAVAQATWVLPYNDLEAMERLFTERGREIAAVIVEPVAGNMGCILPVPNFLKRMHTLCNRYGSLLIFDEVMTGFRVALGGAQAYFGLRPDLTTLGKVIGGGMPVGAYGGRRDLMAMISPSGPVYQAGTLSGNPLAVAAGMATLDLIEAPGAFDALAERTRRLTVGLSEALAEAAIPHLANHIGSMFGIFFTSHARVDNLEQVAACDFDRFNRWFHGMLAAGVSLAPSQYEASFVSLVHDEAILDRTLAAARAVAATLA